MYSNYGAEKGTFIFGAGPPQLLTIDLGGLKRIGTIGANHTRSGYNRGVSSLSVSISPDGVDFTPVSLPSSALLWETFFVLDVPVQARFIRYNFGSCNGTSCPGSRIMEVYATGEESDVGVYHATFTIDKTGPQVMGMDPTGAVNEPFSEVRVTFDQPIASASFTAEDISIVDPRGVSVSINGLEKVGTTTYRFLFAQQDLGGSYSVTIGPQITDAVGNAMDQDGNGVNGEATDRFAGNIVFSDITSPRAISHTPSGVVNIDVASVTLRFDEAVDPASFTSTDVKLTTPSGAVSSSLITVTEAEGADTTPPGLTHHWPGEGNANDVVGANHGAMAGAAAFGVGVVGQGFSFDGNADYVQIARNTFDGMTDFTVTAWVKFDSLATPGTGAAQTIVAALKSGVAHYMTFMKTDGGELILIPNPPKDTDGRREGSGRGWVRELQGRWPGVLG